MAINTLAMKRLDQLARSRFIALHTREPFATTKQRGNVPRLASRSRAGIEHTHAGLGRVVLGHLSSDCNTPDIILKRLRRCLEELGHGHVGLYCAGQHEPTAWFEL